jgi:hypothetical protein
MPCVGFEKTDHALDCAATVVGRLQTSYSIKFASISCLTEGIFQLLKILEESAIKVPK